MNSNYRHPKEFITFEQNEGTILNNKLPFINVECNNVKMIGLVDTGAEVSLISNKIVEENVTKFQKYISKTNKIYLQTTNGKKIAELNRIVNINVKLGEKTVNHNFVIMTGMNNLNILLGNDFLSENEAIIDLKSNEVKIYDCILKLIQENLYNEKEYEKIINNYYNMKVSSYKDEAMTKEKNIEINKVIKIICPDKYLNKVTEILQKYEELYNEEMRITNVYEHSLKVNEDMPYNSRTYPIPYMYRKQVAKEIDEMLKQGIIERSTTNFINPIVVVKKKMKLYDFVLMLEK